MTAISLLDLCRHLRRVTEANYPKALWVRAEIHEAGDSKGNRYLTLLEKEGREVVARLEAMVWAAQRAEMRERLGNIVDEVLCAGRQVQLLVEVQFHERYGLKLLVLDIEPTFTVGALALQRQALVEQLAREKLLERNAERRLALFPQRVAIVSSENAAGLQDFLNQLASNSGGYAFACTLFSAPVQGPSAPTEIAARLAEINARAAEFDCVVLIRGGGSRLDLAAFDDEALCRAVANCALPVLTGIGHETDESVADLVAHTVLKTPTAVAAFLLERGNALESVINGFENQIAQAAQRLVQIQHNRLEQYAQRLSVLPAQIARRAEVQLDHIEAALRLLDPQETLRRGYWLLLKEGRALTSASGLQPGETLVLKGADGDLQIKIL